MTTNLEKSKEFDQRY